jgi:hypothetical protein
MSSRDLPGLFTGYWDPVASIEWKSADRLSCVRYRIDAAHAVRYGFLGRASVPTRESCDIRRRSSGEGGGDRVVRTLGAGGRAVVQDLAVGDGRSRRSPLSTTRLERTEEQQ